MLKIERKNENENLMFLPLQTQFIKLHLTIPKNLTLPLNNNFNNPLHRQIQMPMQFNQTSQSFHAIKIFVTKSKIIIFVVHLFF